MLIFLPFLLLFLTLAALIIAFRFRPDSRNYWLIVAAGSSLAWLAALLLRFRLPIVFSTTFWKINQQLNLELHWQLDSLAWPLLFAAHTLLLATHLAEVTDFSERTAWSWISASFLLALASLSIMAANLPTLAIAWFLADTLYMIIRLKRGQQLSAIRQYRIAFIPLFFSSLALIWVLASHGDFPLSQIPASASLPLLIICGIRLGILPLNRSLFPSLEHSRADDAVLKIATIIPALLLLPRIQFPPADYSTLILVLTLASALYAGVKWLLSPKLKEAFTPFLILGASLTFFAATTATPASSQMWLLVTLIGAGILSILKFAYPFRPILLFISVLLFSGLPFTPLFQAALPFSAPKNAFTFAFLLPQSILLAGWLRQIWKLRASPINLEKWQQSIYTLALFLLPAILLLLPFMPSQVPASAGLSFFSWPLILALALSGLFFFLSLRPLKLAFPPAEWLEALFSFDWLFHLIEKALSPISTVLRFFSRLLEGSAGVLWALLIIALLLSVLEQIASLS